ncbi:MAG TPA: alpha/beta fold hydrolase [Jatrophihabitans sp.]|nr:alpha/beta fold hydrolase [Jatrophihabitans sp.]
MSLDPDRLTAEFFRIPKLPHDPPTKDFLNRCQSHTVRVAGRFYKYYQCGSGPTVLHVHGVRSNLGSMAPIAETLLEQGYQVVLFDAPAHGEALGESTDPIEVRDVIRGVAGRFDELHAVIGHSLGGLWTLAACDGGIRPRAVVSISAPSTMRFLLEKFAEFFALDDAQQRAVADRISGRLGAEVWTELSPVEVVPALGVPGLVLHGEKDDYVPPENAERLHAGWPGSQLEFVDGAGHFDIVALPRVRTRIADYLHAVG